MRFRVFLITGLLAVSTAGLQAGDRCDYSGGWTLNEEKSELNDMGTQFLPLEVAIRQEGNDFTITKIFEGQYGDEMHIEEILTLDGKECKSEFWNSPRVTTAAFSQDGKALTVSSKIAFNRDGAESIMTVNEILTLSEDGKILKIKHHSNSDWGERVVTMVFDKAVAESKAK